jgi:DNA-binding CsgD family transcriptional regulator/tetratricopeptide (TPR) repeat protein
MGPSDEGLVPKAAEEPTPGTLRDSSELLERAVHLSTLEARLADVAGSSRGSLVLVSGEAGVGKTALLRRFCDEQGATARVLWGTCDALFTPRPLGPLFEIAETTGGDLEALVAGGAKAHEVAAALAGEVARRSPAVIVLEDLQQADGATLDVIRLLARKVGTIPALLLASYREDELTLTHPLRIVLGEFATMRELERLALKPLSPEAVAELAQSHELDPHELFRKTAGNPFFVTEVLAAGADAIPDTVRDAVLARAARLSTAARRLLEAVAVVPSHAELWLLEAIAADVVGHLEECLASGMLEAGPEGVAFRHELARLTVEESLTPDRKLTLHRAALAALDAVPAASADLDRLAHHAAGAGDAGAVLRWAPAAAQRASSLGAHREAAAHYQRALRFADSLPGEERAALLEGRAYECYLTGELDEAIAAQERALVQRRRLPDGRAEGDCLRSLSRLYRFLGRTKEAEEVGREAVAHLEESPPGRELAMAYVNLGHLYTVADAAEEALAWTSKAAALGERLDAPEALVYALTNLGAIEMLTGAEAPTKLEQSLDLALRAGLEENAGRAYLNLVWWPVRQRQYDVVDRYLQPGIDYCIERGLDLWRLFFVACRARMELDRSRWGEAADSAALALRDHRTFPVPRVLALCVLALVRARRGDPDVWSPLDEALVLAEPTGELQRIGWVAAASAEAAWLEGEPGKVGAAADLAFELALQRGAAWPLGELACWRWRAGLLSEAPAAAAEPYALQIGGEWKRAADLWWKRGCPYEAALALADADDENALRQALDELLRLGASPAAAIVARRLRKRGVGGLPRGPRPATRDNPANLTRREVEVLELVAQGLRNAEIAQRLFVSRKTVDHHLSAILRKLDVDTRGEASAEAARLGLAGQDR